jgi:hypothetical protein
LPLRRHGAVFGPSTSPADLATSRGTYHLISIFPCGLWKAARQHRHVPQWSLLRSAAECTDGAVGPESRDSVSAHARDFSPRERALDRCACSALWPSSQAVGPQMICHAAGPLVASPPGGVGLNEHKWVHSDERQSSSQIASPPPADRASSIRAGRSPAQLCDGVPEAPPNSQERDTTVGQFTAVS